MCENKNLSYFLFSLSGIEAVMVNAMEMTIELFRFFLSCSCACAAFFCVVFLVFSVVCCEIRINVFFLY